MTAAGLKAIAVDEGSEGAIEPSKATQPQRPPDETNASRPDAVGEHAKTSAPRAGSKLARVIDLLQRSDGATIPTLTKATGWLPHTTRAALTGLRKRGYAVVRTRVDTGESVYRIAGGVADGGNRFVVQPESPDHDREPKPKANQAARSAWPASQPTPYSRQ